MTMLSISKDGVDTVILLLREKGAQPEGVGRDERGEVRLDTGEASCESDRMSCLLWVAVKETGERGRVGWQDGVRETYIQSNVLRKSHNFNVSS